MDSILKFMNEHKIPLTRENYLEIAYMGTPPTELDAEEEAELPEQFQME
jgi:hypothetical protein